MVLKTTQMLIENQTKSLQRLDQSIQRVVLNRQDPISGLLPASTAHTIHGNYGDAWVRDCVYSVQCVWGLALAHRRQQGQSSSLRSWELEQRVVALMRGLLRSMMRQAHKVERFKESLNPLDALHAKYDSTTGEPVVADDAWGHLQLDATSLFLLQLAQLTKGGCAVVQSRDEVDFLQNLVHYIARAYRTPDYGIWERGDKGNHGLPERNASSIGRTRSAACSLPAPPTPSMATTAMPGCGTASIRCSAFGDWPRPTAVSRGRTAGAPGSWSSGWWPSCAV